MKKFKPHYSGDNSRDFWETIKNFPPFYQQEIYLAGVLLQDMEEKVLQNLNNLINYTPNDLKTWIDPKTNLEWNMESKHTTWNEAESYAKSLGQDWRVPTIEELETLLDRGLSYPAVRKEVPFRDSLIYWSSTPDCNGDQFAWIINFIRGYVDSYRKNYKGYVRCVK